MVPPPDKDFFICRVHKSDGVTEISEYITRKGVKFRKLTKASNDKAKLNSFKLTISLGDLNKVKDPLLWPKGWNVMRWHVKTKSESIRNKDVVSLCESLQQRSMLHRLIVYSHCLLLVITVNILETEVRNFILYSILVKNVICYLYKNIVYIKAN